MLRLRFSVIFLLISILSTLPPAANDRFTALTQHYTTALVTATDNIDSDSFTGTAAALQLRLFDSFTGTAATLQPKNTCNILFTGTAAVLQPITQYFLTGSAVASQPTFEIYLGLATHFAKVPLWILCILIWISIGLALSHHYKPWLCRTHWRQIFYIGTFLLHLDLTSSRSQFRPLVDMMSTFSTSSATNEGEGGAPTMGNPDVLTWDIDDVLPLPYVVGTNQHGLLSSTSSGSIHAQWMTGKKVVKRSILRAFRRACKDGITWYRNQLMTPDDFAAIFQLPSTPSRPTPSKMRSYHLPTHRTGKRVSAMVWNAGGLSSTRYWEFFHWITTQDYDIVIVPETRWRFDQQWTRSGWHAIHSMGPDVASGISVLIRTTLTTADHIQWQAPCPGRLLHIRISSDNMGIDVLACYQHSWLPGDDRRRSRRHWWNELDSTLWALPQRHQLILAGDFNCALETQPGCVGYTTFQGRNGPATGFLHPDRDIFHQLLQDHNLTALNTWCPNALPTFTQDGHHSFLIMRPCSPLTIMATGPSFAPFPGNGIQLDAFRLHPHHVAFADIVVPLARKAHVPSPTWEAFQLDIQHAMREHFRSHTPDNIEAVHHTAHTILRRHFGAPPKSKPHSKPDHHLTYSRNGNTIEQPNGNPDAFFDFA